ncbi:PEGA domain-containing protein [Bacteroidota bacterium]
MSNFLKYGFEKFYTICSILLLCTIVLSCERSVSVSPPDEPPPDGYLFVNSSPTDAKIFINGKDRRRTTPDSISWLATNDYEITLKKEYFRDTTFMIQVIEGERTEILIDYLSNPAMLGAINCISRPEGASIFIDGVNTGLVTPSIIEHLLPGPHFVKYIMQDHKEAESIVIVRSSETSVQQATLVNTTIWTEYNMSNSEIVSDDLTDVLVDQRGIIWIGTSSEGIMEFNNDVWINYRESNSSLSNDFINCIEEGPFGNIWVGTFDGLVEIRSSGVLFRWNTKTGFPEINTHINDITTDLPNNVWFATNKGIVSVKISDQFYWSLVIDPSTTDLPGEIVTAIDISGINKWVGTESLGLVRFGNYQNMEQHSTLNGLRSNRIAAIEVDKLGIPWVGHRGGIGGRGGLSRYNGVGWDDLSNQIANSDVSVIFVDSKNRKWIGTDSGLYLLFNASLTMKYSFQSTGLSLNNVKGISEDSEGNIWLATSGDGLIKINTDNLLN